MCFAPALLLFMTVLGSQEPESGFTEERLQKMVREITPRVAKLRGWEVQRPIAAGVQSAEEFEGFARQEFEREYGQAKLQAMGMAYELLGLIPTNTDLFQLYLDLLRGQVGGYYDPASETFYMIDAYHQPGLADIIMAHELMHALDDQYYQLDRMLAQVSGNADAEFAARAVIEGSGMSAMSLYMKEGIEEGYLELDLGDFAESMAGQMEQIENVPPFLMISLALPYLEGNKFLVQESNMALASMKVPDNADIDRAFRFPPTSSEQVLHFEKYWSPDKRDDPTPLKLPDFSASLGEGWQLTEKNILGELGCFVVTAEEVPNLMSMTGQLTGVWTNTAASGWDGDLYQLYVGPNDARLLLWCSVWDSTKDRAEFAARLNEMKEENVAFLLNVRESRVDAVAAFYGNEQGQESLQDLQNALYQARPDWK